MERPLSLLSFPQYIIEEIINRLEDAKEVARAQLVCRDFRKSGKRLKTLDLRNMFLDTGDCFEMPSMISLTWRCVKVTGGALQDINNIMPRLQTLALLGVFGVERGKLAFTEMKVLCLGLSTAAKDIDMNLPKLEKLQLKMQCPDKLIINASISAKLQAKTVSEDEKQRTDFWISDPYFVLKWIPSMTSTLEHLCIVNYGQQAIMRRSTIMRIISENCKQLKTLDLRNMFLDTGDCVEMPSMISLTWRCVKVTGGALQDINNIMPRLQTLALLGVFGVERRKLEFTDLKVLCLGLSTAAKDIDMNLPKLEKLQLKMQCPDKLIINASILKYVAFNLEVTDSSKVEVRSTAGLQELLYGASSFITLSNLADKNPTPGKIFLDIPCMALGEDGRFLGVLKDVPLMSPNFSKLLNCGSLEVMNIRPGLWYSMETNVEMLAAEKWPSISRLVVHMIPMNFDPAIRILQMLLRPSVRFLTIHVHTSSPVKLEKLQPRMNAIASDCAGRRCGGRGCARRGCVARVPTALRGE